MQADVNDGKVIKLGMPMRGQGLRRTGFAWMKHCLIWTHHTTIKYLIVLDSSLVRSKAYASSCHILFTSSPPRSHISLFRTLATLITLLRTESLPVTLATRQLHRHVAEHTNPPSQITRTLYPLSLSYPLHQTTMTSLIGWGVYGIHHSIVSHKREKQRKKNYDRWEGLRDDYDEQKRVSRQSLDSQDPYAQRASQDIDRPIVTLRDQQEANDARHSWRPQEQIDRINPDMTGAQRRASPADPTASKIRPQKTGAVWDEGLPEPLQVQRRSFDDRGSSDNYRDQVSRVASDESQRSASMDVQRPPAAPRKKSDFEVVESPYHWWER